MTTNSTVVRPNSTPYLQSTRRKTATCALYLLGLWAALSCLSLAQSGVVSSSHNPLQLGRLQWNKQDTPPPFTVGTQPYGVVFDGASMWVANSGDGTVSKVGYRQQVCDFLL
jgi:hypothetical protein